MIYLSNENFAPIVIGVVAGVVVLAVLIFLLYHFVISRSAYKKQIKDYEKSFSYLDALLRGQDAQYIRRLEIISRTNLLYLEKHDLFQGKFTKLLDGDDKYVHSLINRCDSLLKNKQYKQLKISLDDVKKSLATFDKSVHELDNELFNVIKPEEEARLSIHTLKESLRIVKQTYYSYSSDLELVAPSFTKVFDKLERKFQEFDACVESAEYDEANSLLPVISKAISSLDKALQVLPNLCVLTTAVVPQKIKDLTEEYNSIEKRGIPLFNISYRSRVDAWNSSLENIKDKLLGLQTSGVLELLNSIQDEISEVRDQLHKEIDDKDIIELNMNAVYAKVIDVEKAFIKIRSLIPNIEKIFKIDDEHKKQIEDLQQIVNNLGTSKRTLESFVHSSTKQPYSLLKAKLDELEADYEIANTGVNDFRAYFDYLKASSEEAYNLVFVYYYRLKQTESILREIGIDNFSKDYEVPIEDSYDLLNKIDVAVKQTPIDVSYVNENVEALKRIANTLFDEIDTKYREEQLAESAVVYSNRDRRQQIGVHQRLTTLEQIFYEGDFAKVYHEASALFGQMHIEDTNINNG